VGDDQQGSPAPKRVWRTVDIQAGLDAALRDKKVRERLGLLRGGPLLRIMWYAFALPGVALPYGIAVQQDFAAVFITGFFGLAVFAAEFAYMFGVRPRRGPIVSIESLGRPGLEIACIAGIMLSLAVLLTILDPISSHVVLLVIVLCVLAIIFVIGRLLTARAKRRIRADPSLARILAEDAARPRHSRRRTRAVPRVVAKTGAQRANPRQDIAAGIRAGRWAVVWSGLAYVAVVITRVLVHQDAETRSELIAFYGPTILICGLLVVVVCFSLKFLADYRQKSLTRKSEQQTAPSAQYAVHEDHRPAMLLLRSFADDVAMNGKARFEETIAPLLMQYGPLVAIGDPNDELPDLGAYRDYVDDTTWQERVRSYIRLAKFIVMIPGQSEWIRWELSEILEGDFLHKTILIFPPGQSLADKMARLNNTWSAFMDRADLTPAQVTNLAETVAIHFFDPDLITCLVDSSIATARSYQYGPALYSAFGTRVSV
jgi:hypothetical protein